MMTSHKKLTGILELFLNDDVGEELTLSEMSSLLGLHKSTVSRIASFLVKENYLQQQGKRGKYSLGTKFLQFNYAMKNRMKIRNIAMRYMEKLIHNVKESCALILWDGKRAILSDSIDHDSVLRASPERKSEIPLHTTAGGKIILANMEEAEIDRYFASGELKETDGRGLPKPDDLKRQLKLIKEQNFAIEIEEHIVGISSVAVGIKDGSGNILGVITVIGPTARLSYQGLIAIVPDIKECTREISKWLGYAGK